MFRFFPHVIAGHLGRWFRMLPGFAIIGYDLSCLHRYMPFAPPALRDRVPDPIRVGIIASLFPGLAGQAGH
jgi:hypothetical protein